MERTYPFWLCSCPVLDSSKHCVIINKRSFQSFLCLDLVLERLQSFLFQMFSREKKIQIASDKEAHEEEEAFKARFSCLFGHWPVSSCSVSELDTAVVSCCYCVHSPTLFPRSCLCVLQKPETHKLCQLLAKP